MALAGCCSGERAVGWRLPADCSATLSGWLDSIGMGGWFASEALAGMDRNHRLLCPGFRSDNLKRTCRPTRQALEGPRNPLPGDRHRHPEPWEPDPGNGRMSR